MIATITSTMISNCTKWHNPTGLLLTCPTQDICKWLKMISPKQARLDDLLHWCLCHDDTKDLPNGTYVTPTDLRIDHTTFWRLRSTKLATQDITPAQAAAAASEAAATQA